MEWEMEREEESLETIKYLKFWCSFKKLTIVSNC